MLRLSDSQNITNKPLPVPCLFLQGKFLQWRVKGSSGKPLSVCTSIWQFFWISAKLKVSSKQKNPTQYVFKTAIFLLLLNSGFGYSLRTSLRSYLFIWGSLVLDKQLHWLRSKYSHSKFLISIPQFYKASHIIKNI